MEIPPTGILMGSLSIRVKNGSGSSVDDHHLCVDTSNRVSLCSPAVANICKLFNI